MGMRVAVAGASGYAAVSCCGCSPGTRTLTLAY